jgi:hypothetical protein
MFAKGASICVEAVVHSSFYARAISLAAIVDDNASRLTITSSLDTDWTQFLVMASPTYKRSILLLNMLSAGQYLGSLIKIRS